MKNPVSPEEKLLRLIRGQKKQGAQTVKPGIKISFQHLLSKYPSHIKGRKILFWALIISCIYLVISLAYPLVALRKISLPKVNEGKISESGSEIKEQTKPFEFYQQGIANRRIFANASGQESINPASAANTDLVKDINLVGVITGANPQAVIEDKKTLKTYYVTKGQFIGEAQIEDIQEGKIILNYRGQRYELYL